MFTYGKDIPLEDISTDYLEIDELTNNAKNLKNIEPLYVYGQNINWESVSE
ncbi:hypothetical protein [Bacillus taeanensis]|uniref:hypothetical protein n=1 Tax=Bacillus taeanensis TaxID=273032 RepID=UPI0015F11404|nr:hypothetical protein [Bacillus taeanensis]